MERKSLSLEKAILEDVAAKYDLKVLGHLPLDSELTKLSDMGAIEEYASDWLNELNETIKEF